MFDREENLVKLDKGIIIATLLLIGCGLLSVYSATQGTNPVIVNNFSKQVGWVALGLIAMGVVILMPIKFFSDYAYVFYGVAVLTLVLTLFVGSGAGATRWLSLGPVGFQPSEVAKVATIFALAKFLVDERRDLKRVPDVALAFLIVLVPLGLIIKQPDLGTSLVFAALLFPMLFWAGLSFFTVFLFLAPLLTLAAAFNLTAFFLVMGFITGLMVLSGRKLRVIVPNFLFNVGVGIMTPILWSKLHKYQQSRILTFLGIEQDPRGIGYQVLQSKVAIGSGGAAGKGWLNGTQTQLRFLPEQHTDFIFSVIGEEFGFIGVMLVLICFFVLLWRSLKIAQQCKSRFSGLVVIGATVAIAFHVIVNTGMTVGIMPVTGLPLPFISYGGSALLINMILVGLILNAGRRQFQYF